MRRAVRLHNALDVRTKLLLMLGALSLPLLLVGLYQLHGYQQSLTDRSAAVARVEAEGEAAALESWVESHPQLAADPRSLSAPDAGELYARLTRRALRGTQAAVAVYDAEGRTVLPMQGAGVLAPDKLPEKVETVRWADGARRVTGVARAEPSGWSVAVGVPAPDGSPAGRSILLLAAAWGLTLAASCVLAVWAVGRFTKPLQSLAASASTLGEGNLHERARVETDDEVGTLASSFNTMAESLEAKFEAVARQSAFIGEELDRLPLGADVLHAKLVVRKVNAAFARMTKRGTSDLTGRSLYEVAAGLSVLSEVVEGVQIGRASCREGVWD